MLAILTSHPIQYQVPLWRALAAELPVRVWYLTDHGVAPSHDAGFDRRFAWDIDLLGGYSSEFLDVGPDRDSTRFRGVRLRESLGDRTRREGVSALWVEGWRLAAFWQAVRAGRSAGVEVWLRGESNDLKRDAAVKSLVKRPLLRRFFRAVDRFLCIGSANRRLYASYGIPPHKFHAAPYFVDNDFFRARADALAGDRDSIRAAWRIPANAYCILFCGKFVPKKRPLDVVRAVERLGSRAGNGRPIHLLFVGSGQLGGELRAACSVVFDADGHSAVKPSKPPASFAGFLNQREIVRAYVAADLLILPSDSGETWGLVVNEAMACGRPAVVSHLCGCAEDLVAPLDQRLVARCGDVDDLAAALRHATACGPSRERVLKMVDTHHLRHTVATVRALYDAPGGNRTHG